MLDDQGAVESVKLLGDLLEVQLSLARPLHGVSMGETLGRQCGALH